MDTRRAAEYTGEERRASRAGAIPGAVHRDYTDNIAADGRFKSPEDIRAAYLSLGLRPDDEIVTYCGGGARAAHSWLALRLAGFDRVSNYTGSWNEWADRSDLPVHVAGTPLRSAAGASLPLSKLSA